MVLKVEFRYESFTIYSYTMPKLYWSQAFELPTCCSMETRRAGTVELAGVDPQNRIIFTSSRFFPEDNGP